MNAKTASVIAASILCWLLACCPVSRAQVQLTAGASQLFDADGAQAVYFAPNSTDSIGLGIGGGHIVASASSLFDFHGFQIVAGDSQNFFQAGQSGLSLPLRGAVISRKWHSLTVSTFAGLTGSWYTSPIFTGAVAHTPNGGARIAYNWHALKLSAVAANGTILESAEIPLHAFAFSETAGKVNGQKIFDADGRYSGKHFSADINQNNYSDPTGKFQRATAAGVFGSVWLINGHANVLGSKAGVGESIGGGIALGPVSFREDYFAGKTGTTNSVSATEHWRNMFLSQTYSGQLNFGGGYSSNSFSVAAGYQEVFNTENGGFSKDLEISFSVRIRGFNVNTSTLAGKITVYGTTWAQVGLPGNARETPASRISGKFIIRGTVHDSTGAPVAGAAIKVAAFTLYSDSTGAFFVRLSKAAPVPVAVLLADFTAPGVWKIVSAPTTASPAAPIAIIISH